MHKGKLLEYMRSYMRGSREFCQRGSNSDNRFFFFDKWGGGGKEQLLKIPLKPDCQGPPAKRHFMEILKLDIWNTFMKAGTGTSARFQC